MSEGKPFTRFQTVPRPAQALRSVLPATRCPPTPDSCRQNFILFPSSRCFLLPGSRPLSSGAQAPKVPLFALPGNSAARTTQLPRPGWALDAGGTARPGLWWGKTPADGLATDGRSLLLPLGTRGLSAPGLGARGCPPNGRAQVHPGRAWPAVRRPVSGRCAGGDGEAPRSLLAPDTPAPRPGAW